MSRNRLYIGNLDRAVQREDLEHIFGKLGRMEEVVVLVIHEPFSPVDRRITFVERLRLCTI
jgi:RNA recognition motif-containing protein